VAALARSAAFYSSVAGLVHPLNWWLHVKSCDPSARQGRISRAHDPTPGSREPSNARNPRLDNRSTHRREVYILKVRNQGTRCGFLG
jgi:hypothetical protein